jgi:hypothetical protein
VDECRNAKMKRAERSAIGGSKQATPGVKKWHNGADGPGGDNASEGAAEQLLLSLFLPFS